MYYDKTFPINGYADQCGVTIITPIAISCDTTFRYTCRITFVQDYYLCEAHIYFRNETRP